MVWRDILQGGAIKQLTVTVVARVDADVPVGTRLSLSAFLGGGVCEQFSAPSTVTVK